MGDEHDREQQSVRGPSGPRHQVPQQQVPPSVPSSPGPPGQARPRRSSSRSRGPSAGALVLPFVLEPNWPSGPAGRSSSKSVRPSAVAPSGPQGIAAASLEVRRPVESCQRRAAGVGRAAGLDVRPWWSWSPLPLAKRSSCAAASLKVRPSIRRRTGQPRQPRQQVRPSVLSSRPAVRAARRPSAAAASLQTRSQRAAAAAAASLEVRPSGTDRAGRAGRAQQQQQGRPHQ